VHGSVRGGGELTYAVLYVLDLESSLLVAMILPLHFLSW